MCILIDSNSIAQNTRNVCPLNLNFFERSRTVPPTGGWLLQSRGAYAKILLISFRKKQKGGICSETAHKIPFDVYPEPGFRRGSGPSRQGRQRCHPGGYPVLGQFPGRRHGDHGRHAADGGGPKQSLLSAARRGEEHHRQRLRRLRRPAGERHGGGHQPLHPGLYRRRLHSVRLHPAGGRGRHQDQRRQGPGPYADPAPAQQL